MVADSHTHRMCEGAIVCVAPGVVPAVLAEFPHAVLSTGIHPWDTAGLSAAELTAQLSELELVATLPEVVAIGEAGLDTLRGGGPEIQMETLKRQILLSERVGKPLILHVVRSGHRILALCRQMERELKPFGLRQPWIWHGYRGGADEAARFLALRKENYISVGSRFNPMALKTVPLDRLLVETDDSPVPIGEVVAAVAASLKLPAEEIGDITSRNLQRVIQRQK